MIMERLATDLGMGEFRCEQVTETGMKIKVDGADVYFRLVYGREKQYMVCTFRHNGAVIHLEEINGFGELVKHLRNEVVKWEVKRVQCCDCGLTTSPKNLIYNDEGYYLCEECFVERAIDEFEKDTDMCFR